MSSNNKIEEQKNAQNKGVKSLIDENSFSILGINVLSYVDKLVGSKIVTFYQVEITSRITKNSWKIDKRYSEFKKLHDAMLKIYPRLPKIPGTTLFKVTSPEALKSRQKALEAFLRSCVQRRDILQNKLFKEFLELEKNAPEIVGNDVDLYYDYKKLPLGCRNFKVIPHRKIMVVCCSNMNILSRSNVMLSNISFSKKNDDDKVPMGALFIYQCEPSKEEVYAIHKIWAKPFPIQTGTLYWEDQNQILSVGNDDGKIYVFKPKPNCYYDEMEQIAEYNVHTDRVMGIGIDVKTNFLYSCSTDKTFWVSDLLRSKNSQMINSTEVGYTNLELDQENRRIFLTTEHGEIYVYSIVSYPPILVRNMQTSSLSSIRAFHIDKTNGYIFTGNVGGKICIMNLPPVNKEKLMSEISNFGVGEMKIRVCVTNPANRELMTGDESGRVVIWSLKIGKPIYLWHAHDMAITQMQYEKDNRQLWTGGKDLRIKLWILPEKWVSEEVDLFDKEEKYNIADESIEKKEKKEGEEEDEEDEDDVTGWCRFLD
jgi:WD40 repeat protein